MTSQEPHAGYAALHNGIARTTVGSAHALCSGIEVMQTHVLRLCLPVNSCAASLCQSSQFEGPEAVDMLRITGLPTGAPVGNIHQCMLQRIEQRSSAAVWRARARYGSFGDHGRRTGHETTTARV